MVTRPETQFATSGDLSIAYQVVGEGPVALLVVPGFVSHVELNWEYVFFSYALERLAEFSKVVIFDKRGCGLSDRTLGNGTLEDRIDDLRAVLDAAGLERAALLGISNGTPLATFFAATYPERVEALALYCGGCPGLQAANDPAFEQVLTLVREFWTTGLVLHDNVIQRASDAEEAIKQLARFERYCCSPAVAAETLQRGREADLRPFLPLVQAPTLVVNHRDDPLVPLAEATYLAEHVPGARQIVLDGDFHISWQSSDMDPALDHVAEFLTGQLGSVKPVPRRVLSTVLFTDIVRSTDQAAAMGDAGWRVVLDRYDDLCVREIERHGGVRVKQTGDGMLARFDSPGRAVTCARVIDQQVGSLGVRTRAGVHTGEVELRGDDLSGLAVHIASRVTDRAEAGEVLVSHTVKDLTIGADLDFVPRGEHELKGVPGTWQLFSVN